MTFSEVRPSRMRHCLCVDCWEALHGPGAHAHTVAASLDPPDTCCRCRQPVVIATYVRDAPSAFPCMGDHGSASDARPSSVIEAQIPCPTCGLPAFADITAMYGPSNLHTMPDGLVMAENAFYTCTFCRNTYGVPYASVTRQENTALGDLLDRLTRDNNPPFPR